MQVSNLTTNILGGLLGLGIFGFLLTLKIGIPVAIIYFAYKLTIGGA